MATVTIHDYVRYMINKYPTTYLLDTKEKSYMCVYDEIFNRLHFLYTFNNVDVIGDYSDRIFDEDVWLVYDFNGTSYTEKDFDDDMRKHSLQNYRIHGLYLKEHIHEMDSKRVTRKLDKRTKIIPGAVYNKKASMLWSISEETLLSFDRSWIYAMIEFYEFSKNFLNSDDVVNMRGYPPSDDDTIAWNKIINEKRREYNSYLYNHMDIMEICEYISSEYGVPFHCNTKRLIKDIWNKDLKNMKGFIDESLDYLDSILRRIT